MKLAILATLALAVGATELTKDGEKRWGRWLFQPLVWVIFRAHDFSGFSSFLNQNQQ